MYCVLENRLTYALRLSLSGSNHDGKWELIAVGGGDGDRRRHRHTRNYRYPKRGRDRCRQPRDVQCDQRKRGWAAFRRAFGRARGRGGARTGDTAVRWMSEDTPLLLRGRGGRPPLQHRSSARNGRHWPLTYGGHVRAMLALAIDILPDLTTANSYACNTYIVYTYTVKAQSRPDFGPKVAYVLYQSNQRKKN